MKNVKVKLSVGIKVKSFVTAPAKANEGSSKINDGGYTWAG